MKNSFSIALMVSALISLAACSDLIETSMPATDPDRAVTLTATREDVDANTRSVCKEDGAAWWGPAEEISVFAGSGTNGGSKFISKNTAQAATAEFEGSISVSGNTELWAVYPYSSGNSCDGSSVLTVIPSRQTGSEGNFADDAFPAIGKSNSLSMPFWNICGGIKFFVSRDDIKSVTFRGNKGEAIAGTIRLVFGADGKPAAIGVPDGKKEVTLVAPGDGCFKAGTYYYMTLLPVDLDSGFTMTFEAAAETGSFTSNMAQSVKRSTFGVLKNVDSKVTRWDSTIAEQEWVDLGLSVKWSAFNVGATRPEEYGDYFAWGETEPKSDYSWATYAFNLGTGSSGPFSEYVTLPAYGTVDNKTVLDPEDDAAQVNWGGLWRMPTDAELDELRNNCTWTWTSNYSGTGVAGDIVTSNKPGYSDKSIFLPASGSYMGKRLSTGTGCNYWSSSGGEHLAYGLIAGSASAGCFDSFRSYGYSVRPVYGEFVPVEYVTLSQISINLGTGASAQLTATVAPSNASAPYVRWISEDDRIVMVDEEGTVTALGEGTTSVRAYSSNGLSASCSVRVTKVDAEVEWVDLGLSVKWAPFNLGAAAPEESGYHIAWGETAPKSNYDWTTYKWCNGSSNSFTKYCPSSQSSFWGGSGSPDDKAVLDLEDDAAHGIWGGLWRTPTDTEWAELRDNCTWTWTDNYNGTDIKGIIVTSQKPGYTGKSIFLPAVGLQYGTNVISGDFGEYLSSSLYSGGVNDPAWCNLSCITFNSRSVGTISRERSLGVVVRPVYGEFIPVSSIVLGSSSLNLTAGSSARLTASVSPSNASAATVRWLSGNERIVRIDTNGNVSALAEGSTSITAYSSNGLRASCRVTVSP